MDRIPTSSGQTLHAEAARRGGANQRTRRNKRAPTANGSAANINQIPFERGDHVELAERVIAILRFEGPVVFAEGRLWRYGCASHIYEPVAQAHLSQILQGFAGSVVSSSQKRLQMRATDISGAIKCLNDQAADSMYFAAPAAGIVFANGFVAVGPQHTEVRPHSWAHRARTSYPFPFDPVATPRKFLRFLEEAFRADADATTKIDLLQEFIGVAVIGLSTRLQKALVLVGPGANGKSVFAAVVEAAMPTGSVVAIPPQDLEQEYRRALLTGKSLNIVSELPNADIRGSEILKAVIAGDPITGREIRQSPYTFRPIAGHLFATNQLPGTRDQSHGFWRRLLVVEFNRIFATHEQNPTLAVEIVREELPAIVSWFLRGAERVLATGHYTLPPSSVVAVERWKRKADHVLEFVSEQCDRLGPNVPIKMWTPAAVVYRRYRDWALRSGHRPVACNTFGERMALLGLPSHRTNSDRLYCLKFLDPDDEPE